MSDKKTKSKAKADAKPAPQADASPVENAPMPGTDDAVLGTLSGGARTQASASADSPKGAQEQKEAPQTQMAESNAPSAAEGTGPNSGPAAETEPEPLRLPRGAFIALRKSGGLQFTTRELVVYPDGRIAYDVRGVPQKEYTRLRRAMNDGQVLSLRKLLDQANFWKVETTGQQNPDAFAYEIAARIGLRANQVTVFDGSIPESFKPILERLTKLLPE